MTKKMKRDIILIIAFGICLYVGLNNLRLVVGFFKTLVTLCLPLVLGFTIAFILNVPMRGYEKLLDKATSRAKHKIPVKAKNIICLLLAIVSILIVFVIVFNIAIPRVTASVKSLIATIDSKIPSFLAFLQKNGVDTTFITEKLSEFNLAELIQKVTKGAFDFFTTAVGATVSVVKYISAAIFAIIIGIYLLLDKQNLSAQTKKACYAFLPERNANYIYKTAYLIRDTFAKFLSGQCFEAIILAVLLFLLFTLFKLPYASLVAVLAAVLSFVPYVGQFIACFVGALLTLIIMPQKTILCIVIFLAAQFVEQHFIYPHVVGTSVGLSPFYTIVAVIIGGNLFGVFGMIFFIPIFSVISVLLGDYIADVSTKKKAKISNSEIN